jgi:hypothetical protein
MTPSRRDMTEKQFIERARRIHASIEKLQKDMAVAAIKPEDEESVAELLHEAKWKIFDVAYPA